MCANGFALRSIGLFAALAAALAILVAAGDASAVRRTSYICSMDGGWQRCGPPQKGALDVEVSRPTCRAGEVVRLRASALASGTRKVEVRLDGKPVATSTRGRPDRAAVGVDCASLTRGKHAVTATLRRDDGRLIQGGSARFTRIDGEPESPSPADDWDWDV
jgi:hypothetical protein